MQGILDTYVKHNLNYEWHSIWSKVHT